jgi:pimeloyl-ACP methyl ester carboxylesterase
MRIEPFTATCLELGDTPCLLCEPLPGAQLSAKGLRIRAQLTAAKVPLPALGSIVGTLVLLHGHTGRKEDHLPVAERFCAVGFRCLLLDLPGHGEHPQPFASFGKSERVIPGVALRVAAEHFGFKMGWCGLFGISQGGAIVLQTAAAEPGQWNAVAELAGFADLGEVVDNKTGSFLGPMAPLLSQPMHWLCRWRAGYDPSEIRPIDACAQLGTMPVLIGHGDGDEFVPMLHAQRLFDAVRSVDKQRLLIAGAGHHDVLVTAAPVYAALAEFFLKHVGAVR